MPKLRALHQIAIVVAITAAVSAPVAAANVGEMGAMDMNNPNGGAMTMTPGEADAISSQGMTTNMHDPHIMNGDMSDMMAHMKWTDLRPANAADAARADQIVATLKAALAKYRDYHAAEAAGYKPFHPEITSQKVVHFTKRLYALKAAFVFNPAEPTSLLYERTPQGGYKLIGAMYTAPRRWTPDDLNARVPLSVARWHQHIDICLPNKKPRPGPVNWKEFGPRGSITTAAECAAADGRFYPVLFGWMVHVYPWEKNPQEVWAH